MIDALSFLGKEAPVRPGQALDWVWNDIDA